MAKSIIKIDDQPVKAKQSINICVTIRNGPFGFYIYEYEVSGSDRAQYGKRLLEKLSEELQKSKGASASKGNLKVYRQFYQIYSAVGP